MDYSRFSVRGINSRYYVGVDLGQRQDHTAIAVLDRAEIIYQERDPVSYDWYRRTEYQLRHVERLPLGTPYNDVVHRIRRVVTSSLLNGPITLTVDATGVGLPVTEMIRDAKLGCRLIPVVITAGERESSLGVATGVPKKVLLASVQVMLAEGKLRIASRMQGAEALLEELSQMRILVSDKLEWREGKHDDMVFATALACWTARKNAPGTLGVARRLL